jgi:hypothetical protein
MLQKIQNEESRVTTICVPDEMTGELVMELAREQGIDASVDTITGKKLWLSCGEEESAGLLETARSVSQLLKLRHLEAMVEAAVLAGGKPSGVLLEELQRTQGYELGRRLLEAD